MGDDTGNHSGLGKAGMTPMFGLDGVIRSDRAWETKGRGITVFGMPPGSAPSTHGEDFQVISDLRETSGIDTDSHRVMVTKLTRDDLYDEKALRNLCEAVLLPAYYRKIPVYIFSEVCLNEIHQTESLIDGSKLTISTILSAQSALLREQAWSLISQMCIVFPTPDCLSIPGQVAMTPIEADLAKEFSRRKWDYEAQRIIGDYQVDFAIDTPSGVLVVEADGRGFHNPTRDALRDKDLVDNHRVIQVLRFSGSRIFGDLQGCADAVANVLTGLREGQPDCTIPPTLILGPEQEPCLRPLQGVTLTLAPAGSGKTRVLARRVVEAVRCGAKAKRIMCVVYNTRAREEMEKRIHEQAGLWEVGIRTMHSLGWMICRAGDYAGFDTLDEKGWAGAKRHRTPKALYREALKRALAESGQRLGADDDGLVNACQEYGGLLKRMLQVPDQPVAIDETRTLDPALAARVEQTVQEELSKRNLVLFDDHIYRAIEVLLRNPELRRRFQHAYDMVLVDEFQDLTPAMFRLIHLISKPLDNLFVVGDDDQMIYSFTCADPRNIGAFDELFLRSNVRTLGLNYRSDPTIVRKSANLISYNRQRKSKNIRPFRETGRYEQSCELESCRTLNEEATATAAALKRWHAEGVPYKDIAVLVRVKNLAVPIQNELKKSGIPHVPLDGATFYNSALGMLIGAYLRLVNDPWSAQAEDFERALKTPFRYIKQEHIPLLAAHTNEALSGTDWQPDGMSRLTAANVAKFFSTLNRVHSYSVNHPAVDVFSHLVSQFELDRYARDTDTSSYDTGIISVQEFLDTIRSSSTGYPVFSDFVNYYREQAIAEAQNTGKQVASNADKVIVSTIHKVKGQEFKNVVLFHVAEGILPHKKSVETGSWKALEEERRVLYVGITRAEDRLLITTESGKQSRFLRELDAPYEPPSTDPIGHVAQTPVGTKQTPPAEKKASGGLFVAIYDFICGFLGIK